MLQFDVETDPAVFGFGAQCVLWLTVVPTRISAVAQAIGADPEIAFVGATTGTHNLFAIVVLRDEAALYSYLTDRLAALDGISAMETAPVTSYSKRAAPAI